MNRPRVLLLEDDLALQTILRDMLDDEQIDVTVCTSLADLQNAVVDYPDGLVVSDSWRSDSEYLSLEHQAEIVALGKSATVILTTGRPWARRANPQDFGAVVVMPKPFDIEDLLGSIHAAFDLSGGT